jgi:hypothetical protein
MPRYRVGQYLTRFGFLAMLPFGAKNVWRDPCYPAHPLMEIFLFTW